MRPLKGKTVLVGEGGVTLRALEFTATLHTVFGGMKKKRNGHILVITFGFREDME